jgi:hypothetical protein
MPPFAGTRIDQRRHVTRNEPRGVAVAGHRSWIERVDRNGLHEAARIRLRPTTSDTTT